MKIVFVAGHEFILKQDNGGKQCSFRNYNLLKEIVGQENLYLCTFSNDIKSDKKKHIKVFPTYKNKKEQVVNSLHFRNSYLYKDEKKIIAYINSLKPDIAFFDFSITGRLMKKLDKQIKIVVFFHNVERNYVWNKVKHESVLFLLPFFSYAYNELLAIKYADDLICLNERDKKNIGKIYKRKVSLIMPMTFRDSYDLSKVKENVSVRKKLLFVGSLFGPNYDGIKWMVENVMTKLPEFDLTIVGKDMEKKKKQLSAPNVKVIGTVDELAPYYYEADAVVIPIFYGDGMKIKTAEAMMYGKIIFASAEALEGYDFKGVKGIMECNSEEEFVVQIREYFREKREKNFSIEVRNLFLEKYEYNSSKEKMRQFIMGYENE